MRDIKKINHVKVSGLIRDFSSLVEFIRSRQDEKQKLLNDFESESKRYFFGKVSRKTLESSASKTNKEIFRLDSNIRKSVLKASTILKQATKMVLNQNPPLIKATAKGLLNETGVLISSKKKKK